MGSYRWLVEVCLGLMGLGSIQLVITRISHMIRKKAKSEHDWRNELNQIVKPPLMLFIWGFGLTYALAVVETHFDWTKAIPYLGYVRKSTAIAAFTWFFLRLKNACVCSFLNNPTRRFDLSFIQLVGKIATLSIFLISGLSFMHVFGVDLLPFLTVGSIGAATIGFASKDIVANFCSGMSMQITKSFNIGDYIHLPEKSIEGKVEEIGWFRTFLRSKDMKITCIPNSYFSNLIVMNSSRASYKYLYKKIEVEHTNCDKIPQLTQQIQNLLRDHEGIAKELPIYVSFSDFTDKGCFISLEAYSTELDQTRFNNLQQDILVKISSLLATLEMHVAHFKVTMQNGCLETF
jgi:MscS family membrane protein